MAFPLFEHDSSYIIYVRITLHIWQEKIEVLASINFKTSTNLHRTVVDNNKNLYVYPYIYIFLLLLQPHSICLTRHHSKSKLIRQYLLEKRESWTRIRILNL